MRLAGRVVLVAGGGTGIAGTARATTGPTAVVDGGVIALRPRTASR